MRNPKRVVAVAVFLGLLIMTMSPSLCHAQVTSWKTLVSDSAICDSIDSNNEPVNREYTFGPTDFYVYSWIEFQNVPSGVHTVTWDWYMPNGTLYSENYFTIPASSNDAGWVTYSVWAHISINGYPPSTLPGNWTVDTYVDRNDLLVQNFEISSNFPAHYIAGVPYYSQGDNPWCGEASMQMVLGFYGVEESQDQIANSIFDYGNQSTWNYDMQTYAENLGFNSTAFEGSIDALKQTVDSGIPVIVVMQFSETDSTGHYRVVVGYDDQNGVIITYDPAMYPNYNITYNEFADLWLADNWTLAISTYASEPSSSESALTPSPTLQTPEFPTNMVTAAVITCFLGLVIGVLVKKKRNLHQSHKPKAS